MKKAGGFTLIELVVVIVILGILSVVAAPKFLNLQDDARNSALSGLKGAMHGSSSIVYGKAAIDGIETVESGEQVEGIDVAYGYPTADINGIGEAVEGLDSDWKVVSTGEDDDSSIHYSFTSSENTVTDCYVTYTQSIGNGQLPEVTVTECGDDS